jgi:hypothetical protein
LKFTKWIRMGKGERAVNCGSTAGAGDEAIGWKTWGSNLVKKKVFFSLSER